MKQLKWWMRIVGVFYLLLFVMATFVHLPVYVFTPEEVLSGVSPDEFMFRFLVDTWVMFGLELGVIGAALLIASRIPERARVLVWTVIAIEFVRGIVDDIYMIIRGYELAGLITWIVIHSIIIITGILALRKGKTAGEPFKK